ncbi:hypothetical protein IKJ53_03985 [bacterium]|nr:hypothetical protein [bacterium]
MKRNFNVIQINGFRGLIMAAGIVACLIAGFIAFPGFVMKSIWNLVSTYSGAIPSISIMQGVLLWGITVVACLAFKKKGMFVEFKSTNDLSQAEMDEVMQRIRIQRQMDIMTKAMMNAKAEMDSQKALNTEENQVEEIQKNNIDI